METKDKLTNRQQRFVDEYVKDFNATQAAIRVGYSVKSARSIGCENLTKPNIKAAVRQKMEELGMSSNEVLKRLTEMGRGDMGDFLDISSMAYQLDLDKAKEKGLTHLIKKVKQKTVTIVQRDGTEEETNTLEVELYDAQNALIQLGRHHALFTDKNEITGKDGAPIKTDDEGHNRSISKLADALREIVSGAAAKQDGEVDTPE